MNKQSQFWVDQLVKRSTIYDALERAGGNYQQTLIGLDPTQMPEAAERGLRIYEQPKQADWADQFYVAAGPVSDEDVDIYREAWGQSPMGRPRTERYYDLKRGLAGMGLGSLLGAGAAMAMAPKGARNLGSISSLTGAMAGLVPGSLLGSRRRTVPGMSFDDAFEDFGEDYSYRPENLQSSGWRDVTPEG